MLVVVVVDGGLVGCQVGLPVADGRVNCGYAGGSFSTGRPSSPMANTPMCTDGAKEEGGEG